MIGFLFSVYICKAVSNRSMQKFVLFRYGTAYWMEMENLQITHPFIYESNMLHPGSWTVRRCDFQPFSSVAADQAIEQTVNRDSKTSGGLKGITLKRGKFDIYCLKKLLFIYTFSIKQH